MSDDPPPAAALQRRRLRVLLVEDSKVLTERLREALSLLDGVDVVGAVDTEATATARAREPGVDVIVLDLQLREGTGFGVLRDLGADRPAVVVLTNCVLPEYRRCAKQLGADHFLNKSADYERLADVIGELRETRGH